MSQAVKSYMLQLCCSFLRLAKGGTEIEQACGNCRIPGFCESIVLAFIWGVELFDYVVDGENLRESCWEGVEPNKGYDLKYGENQTLRTPCNCKSVDIH